MTTKNFKQYLSEGAHIDFAPWHIRDPQKVQDYFDKHSDYGNRYKINKDGTINATTTDFTPLMAYGAYEGKHVLMSKFRRAKHFQIISTELESLWGVPDVCENLSINCQKLSTLEHLTPVIDEELFINAPKLKKLNTGFILCKTLKLCNLGSYSILDNWQDFKIRCNDIIFFEAEIKKLLKHGGLLNLCKVSKANGSNIEFTIMNSSQTNTEYLRLQEALKIISNFNGDILQCQDELLDAGLKEFARQ